MRQLTKFSASKRSIGLGKTHRSIKDIRLWLGVFFVVLSIFITQSVLTKATARTTAVVVKKSIPAGSPISATDISHAQVVLPEDVMPLTLDNEVIGMRATRDLFSGDVLTKDSLSNSAPVNMRLISTPIKAGHLPAIEAGQLVDIWVTPSTDGMALPGPARLVIAQAVIDSVPLGVDPTSDSAVTLLISEAAVGQLVQAMRDGVIDIVALPGNRRS